MSDPPLGENCSQAVQGKYMKPMPQADALSADEDGLTMRDLHMT